MSQARDLIAELDAEFGKEARKKQKIDGKTTVQGRNSTGTFSDVAAASNAVSRSWKNQPGWKAKHRLTYIIKEHCRACPSTVEYIGNVFTVFENKRLHSRTKSAEIITHDEYGKELPHYIEEHDVDVDYCVSCLRLSTKIDDLVAAALINGYPTQLAMKFSAERDISL